MNVAQMLAHCQVPLNIALCEMKPESTVLMRIIAKLFKRAILEQPEFRRNSHTFKEAVITDVREFQQEMTKLLALVVHLGIAGAEGITKEPHPFFGKMSSNDWNTLQSKHLDHPLRQFGA